MYVFDCQKLLLFYFVYGNKYINQVEQRGLSRNTSLKHLLLWFMVHCLCPLWFTQHPKPAVESSFGPFRLNLIQDPLALIWSSDYWTEQVYESSLICCISCPSVCLFALLDDCHLNSSCLDFSEVRKCHSFRDDTLARKSQLWMWSLRVRGEVTSALQKAKLVNYDQSWSKMFTSPMNV